MRKEATLKMWWELYEVACRTADIKPWDYLTKEQHVVIQLKGEKEPVFIRVLGQENEEDKEIEIYPGFRGWQDLTMIQGLGEGEESELSEDYAGEPWSAIMGQNQMFRILRKKFPIY